jgi:hypothetical protein
MQNYRCKCGNATYYGSGEAPKPCQGCDECNTTYAQRPEDHKEREPHKWKPQFDVNTGLPDRPICVVCYRRGDKPL